MGKAIKIPCRADRKLVNLEMAYGLKGYVIAIKLIQKIVGSGGMCKWNDSTLRSFLKENNLTHANKNLVNEVVLYCVRMDIFVSSLYKQKKILMLDKSSYIGRINGGI